MTQEQIHIAMNALHEVLAHHRRKTDTVVEEQNMIDAQRYLKKLRQQFLVDTNWATAPDWANYHAVQANGRGVWLSKKCEPYADGWAGQYPVQIELDREYTLTVDWRKTLTKRP